jgi:hypothetical protein
MLASNQKKEKDRILYINEDLIYKEFEEKFTDVQIQEALKHINRSLLFIKCEYINGKIGYYPCIF